MNVIWSPLALDRITEIAKYIADENKQAAIELVDNLFSRVNQLSDFPESGQSVPELGRSDVRQLVDGKYRIVYKIEPDSISVLTVRHHRQTLTENDV